MTRSGFHLNYVHYGFALLVICFSLSACGSGGNSAPDLTGFESATSAAKGGNTKPVSVPGASLTRGSSGNGQGHGNGNGGKYVEFDLGGAPQVVLYAGKPVKAHGYLEAYDHLMAVPVSQVSDHFNVFSPQCILLDVYDPDVNPGFNPADYREQSELVVEALLDEDEENSIGQIYLIYPTSEAGSQLKRFPGVKFVPAVATLSNDDASRWISRCMEDDVTGKERKRIADKLVNAAAELGADGLDIDIENFQAYEDTYKNLVMDIGKEARNIGLPTSIAVPVFDAYGDEDWANAVRNHISYCRLMTYREPNDVDPSLTISPWTLYESHVDATINLWGSDRVLIGIPAYGNYRLTSAADGSTAEGQWDHLDPTGGLLLLCDRDDPSVPINPAPLELASGELVTFTSLVSQWENDASDHCAQLDLAAVAWQDRFGSEVQTGSFNYMGTHGLTQRLKAADSANWGGVIVWRDYAYDEGEESYGFYSPWLALLSEYMRYDIGSVAIGETFTPSINWTIEADGSSVEETLTTGDPTGKTLDFEVPAGYVGDYIIRAYCRDGAQGHLELVQERGLFVPPPAGDPVICYSARVDGQMGIWTMEADGSNHHLVLALPNASNVGCGAWSPDKTKIAYFSNEDGGTDLYVVNVDGSGKHRVTTDGAVYYQPDWEDNDTLVFMTTVSGEREIGRINIDGSGKEILTTPSDGKYENDPKLSPDRTKIAVARGSSSTSSLVVYTADYPSFQNLQVVGNIAGDGDRNPDWSANGKIAWNTVNGHNIYMANADGSGVSMVSPGGTWDAQPVFSADGSKLVFRNKVGGIQNLWMVDLETQERQQMVAAQQSIDADWYVPSTPPPPPGDPVICYAGKMNGQWGIYVTDSEGSYARKLCNSDSVAGTAFSPDGERIAFASNEIGSKYKIFVVNTDGTGKQQTISANGDYVSPCWQDNEYILCSRGGIPENEVYRVRVDGSGFEMISKRNNNSEGECWFSPDGTQLAISNGIPYDASSKKIYIVDYPSMSNPRLIGDVAGNERGDRYPCWSNSTNLIAFSAQPDNGAFSYIYHVDSSGGNLTCLSPPGAKESAPRFSPNGSEIVCRVRVNDGNYQVWIISAEDGGNRRNVSSGFLSAGSPDWYVPR